MVGTLQVKTLGWLMTTGLAVTGLLLSGGCATYVDRTEQFVQAYKSGNTQQLVKEAEKMAGTVDVPDKTFDQQSKGPKQDRLLLRLEQASAYRLAADYDRSNLAFQHALELANKYDEEAKIKLGQEGVALVSNLTVLDYRGPYHDRVMLSTYRAMNYLESGRGDLARPELLAAYASQQDAVDKYAKRIEAERAKALKDAEKQQGKQAKADVQKSLDDPQTKTRLDQVYAPLNAMAGYEDYVNPFAEYLQGLYFLHAAMDSSDIQRGVVALRKVNGLVPGNPFVDEDRRLAEGVSAGQTVPPLTYVIFETGLAPRRDQIRIDIPIFLFNIVATDTQVDYVGMAFPKLEPVGNFLPYLVVDHPQGSVQTAVVADMDAVIAREFKNELPAVITKTIAASATKAALAYGASRATEGNDWANIITRVSATVYQAAVNQADLRGWRTLPKQIQVASMPTPENRTLNLRRPDGGSLPTITLQQGMVNVVYVRSASTTSPIFVRQFVLK